MVRLIIAAACLCGLAFAVAWLVDHPGVIAVTWFGYLIETSTAVAVVALVSVIAITALAWRLLMLFLRSPRHLRQRLHTRVQDKGLAALSRGLVAVGAGDAAAAQKAAREADRLVGVKPLALLLRSQAAQLAGDREAAKASFRAMLDSNETMALGLRGLYVEARREGDHVRARNHAEKALAHKSHLPWAAHATLAYQAGSHDWDGAMATLSRQADQRILSRDKAKRLKAVVLTGKAIDMAAHDRTQARALALEAHHAAPDLVPAAVLAADLLAETGEVARASRIIETAWRLGPHPELADAYAHARIGDSAQDRVKRARTLLKLAPDDRESIFAMATAHMEARDFAAALAALQSIPGQPTRRHCLFFARLAEAEGKEGEGREWLQRAALAPADPAWTADGIVSDRWLPVSPVSGDLDAFVWQAPAMSAETDQPVIVLPHVPAAPPEALPPPVMHPRDPKPQGFVSPARLTPAAPMPQPVPKPLFIPDDPGPPDATDKAGSQRSRPTY